MQKLTFNSIGKILDKRTRRKLLGLAIARVAANLLDLVGLAGIALLATSFGSLSSGAATRAPLNMPGLGEVLINEVQAVVIAAIVATVFLMKSIFSIWLNLLTSLTVAGLEGKFSREIAEKFFAIPSMDAAEENDSVAKFQNLALNSTYAISTFLNARMTFLAEVSLLIAMTLIFILVNPIAAASISLMMGLVLFFLNKLIGHRISRNGRVAMLGSQTAFEASRDLFGVRREALASGATPTWISKFAFGRAQAAEGGALIYTLNSLPRYVVETSLILGIFLFIGGVVVFSDLPSQAVTIGVFMAGGLRLVGSLLPLQGAFNAMQDASTRGGPAFNLLLESRARHSIASPEVVTHLPSNLGVNFNQVSFTYADTASPVLIDINISIDPLSKVAIVGPSGAGKSTLFDLATGFLEPISGSVTVGGFNPRSILMGAPGTFGLVTQRPQLVTGSILENVSLLSDAVTDADKVAECLTRAGLGRLAVDPNWSKLQIRPDAGELSGGEIQRIGIARALYRNPKILFLDEATSALDAETESQITEVLVRLKKEMTVVLIAHRLSSVMNADKIIYLDSGRVVAEGTFAELKKKVPDFAKAVALMDLGERE